MIIRKIPHPAFLVGAFLFLLLGQISVLRDFWQPERLAMLAIVPYFIWPLGLLLSLRFNRSRLTLALLVSAVLVYLLAIYPEMRAPWRGRAIMTMRFLWPLFLGLLVWKGEKGVFSPPGLLWTTPTLLITLAPVLMWNIEPQIFTDFYLKINPLILPLAPTIYYLAAGLSLISAIIAYIKRRGATEIAFI